MVILIIFLCKRSGAECLGLDNDGNWSQNSWIAWWWWVCQSDWCHSKHLGQFVICDCCFISWLLVKVLGLKTKLKTVCNGYYYYFFWPISTKPQAWILRKSNNGCNGCSVGRHGVLKRDRAHSPVEELSTGVGTKMWFPWSLRWWQWCVVQSPVSTR